MVALALAMERIAFRPFRQASPATLLITSFALSFLLQSVAALIWGSLPRTTDFASGLSSSFTIGSVAIQKLDVVIVAVTLALLVALALFLRRTTLGTQMRAAAEDFQMARVLGIRANTVIAAAFALSGLLAAVAAILLTAQTGTVVAHDRHQHRPVRVHRDDRRRDGKPAGCRARRLLDRRADGRACRRRSRSSSGPTATLSCSRPSSLL